MGRGNAVLRAGGEVMRGGSGGWFGFVDGGETAGGDVAGDELGDMTAVIADAGGLNGG